MAKSQRLTKTKHVGVYRVHERGCDTDPCRCKPNYQAAVYVKPTGRDEKGKLVRKHHPTEKAAVLWRGEATNAAHHGALTVPTRRTIADAGDELIAGMKDGTYVSRSRKPYKPSTIRSYERALDLRINKSLGRLRVADVRAGHLQRFADELIRSGLDPSTVRNTFDPLRVIFRRARRLGEIHADPTDALELPAPQGKRTVALGPQDALKLIEVLPEGERAFWAVALFCGLRRGELRALRWTDIELSGNPATVSVTRTWDDDEGEVSTKSEAGERVVALPQLVARLLARHGLTTERSGDDLVFGRTATAPFIPSTIRRRAIKAWGESYLSAHQARHAAASFLISRADVSTLELTRAIGHSDVRTTMNIYGHLMPDSGSRVAASLDAMIQEAGS